MRINHTQWRNTVHNPVYEVVIFGLKDTADRQQFIEALPAADAFLKRQRGFIDRTLLAEAGGERWVDIVRWESKADATAAFEAFGRELAGTPFEVSIDQASVVALHATPFELAVDRDGDSVGVA